MLVVERHHITGNDTIIRLCSNSKELYNQCNFLMRHAWFGGHPLPDINSLIAAVKDTDCFKSLHNTNDRDPLPVYEKGVSHVFSGKRVKRGLYRAKDGRVVNADVNGSCNIGRKVIGNEDLFLRLDKSLAARPVRINPLKAFCV